jgi:hypothetical protein
MERVVIPSELGLKATVDSVNRFDWRVQAIALIDAWGKTYSPSSGRVVGKPHLTPPELEPDIVLTEPRHRTPPAWMILCTLGGSITLHSVAAFHCTGWQHQSASKGKARIMVVRAAEKTIIAQLPLRWRNAFALCAPLDGGFQ